MNRPSLSARIALLLGVSTVLIVGIAAVVMDRLVDTEMVQRFDDNLRSQAGTVVDLATPGSAGTIPGDAGRPRQRMLQGKTAAAYAIHCDSGQQIHSEPAPPSQPADWMTDIGEDPEFTDLEVDGQAWRTLRFRFNIGLAVAGEKGASGVAASDTCNVLMMQPRAELDDILDAIDNILLLTPLAALLAVLLLSPMLVRRGLRPLATLAERMRHIGPQAIGQRLHASGPRELEPVVTRFNEVLDRMDEGVLRERQFAGALAHETRTRLAELRALVDVERRYPSGRPTNELLEDLGNIGFELENIVSGLLLLTRLDAGIASLRLEHIDLDDQLASQLEHLATTLQQRKLRIAVKRSADKPDLVADSSLLGIVLGNLLANAASYTPKGGIIHIRRERNALIISNPTPDLDTVEVENLGQRHWSKHHGTGGHTGLGLTLAGAAAKAMNLQLTFSLDTHRRLQASLQWHAATRAPDSIDRGAAGQGQG